ncbi:MAG: hypothetical protein J6T15_04965 [Bacilli bacterium]|nr:hypothetical protein [Bacilli bacterium]
MKILKENTIIKTLKESDVNAEGLTLMEVIDKLYGGSFDCDVSDVDIDILVCFSYDKYVLEDDEYSRFLRVLAERTKVVKQITGEYGNTYVCDFSSVFKPYNDELMNIFNMNNSEFDDSEAYYEAVVNLEALIPGYAGERTYKELSDILEGKGEKLEPVNQFNHKSLDEAIDLSKNRAMAGALDKNKIAKFLKDAVNDLQTTSYTCSQYILDPELAIYVGWSAGWGDEIRDDIIQDKENPDYGLTAGIRIRATYWADFEYLDSPYFKEDGEYYDADLSMKPNMTDKDYIKDAEYLIKCYKEIRKGLDKGTLIYESKKVKGKKKLNESKKVLKEGKEKKKSKLSSNDIFDGVNFEFKSGSDTFYMYASWYDNFDFEEEIESGNIPEDANEEDWGAIYFDIYDTNGENIDGGLMVTDEDDFTVESLCSDLADLAGYSSVTNAKLIDSIPNKDGGKGAKVTLSDLDSEGKNYTFTGDRGNGEEEMILNFFTSGNADGIDYTFYTKDGSEVDGGVLEVDSEKTWNSPEEVAKEIIDFQGIKNKGDLKKLNDGSIEDILEESVKSSKKVLKEANRTKLIKSYLDCKLERDGSGYDIGTSFKQGETVEDFIKDNHISIDKPLYLLNRSLRNNGIKPVRAWLDDEETYNKFKNYVDWQLRDGAIDDPNYVMTLSDEEYNNLLVNSWMKDEEMRDAFEEFGLEESMDLVGSHPGYNDFKGKDQLKKALVSSITDWIDDNYGSTEADEPCYNMKKLVDTIIDSGCLRQKDLKTVIYGVIISWIDDNYGSTEADEPCYDMKKLTDVIVKTVQSMKLKESDEGIINPDEKEYYDDTLYLVGLYPGVGYELATFKVYANSEEGALETVVAYCEEKGYFGLITPINDLEKEVEETYKDEFAEYQAKNPESDSFDFITNYLNYIYIDATPEGASKPYFIDGQAVCHPIDKINESIDYDKIVDEGMTVKELDDIAQWLYDYRREEWDKFTDIELIELAKLCQLTDENPFGRSYDDEVFDEMDRRGLSLNKNEAVTTSEPKSATQTTNSKKVKDYLNYELQDDDTETGGVSFNGETVEDFIKDADIKDDDDLDKLNKALVSCGIKPITEGYEGNYRGDDYWDLSDSYTNGNITEEELAQSLLDMYDSRIEAVKAFKEITDNKAFPRKEKSTGSDIKEITDEEMGSYIEAWDNGDELPFEGDRFITVGDGDGPIRGVGGNGIIVALDNRTGDCWVEEFDSKDKAISWLNDEFNVGDVINEEEKRRIDESFNIKSAYVYEINLINIIVTNGQFSGYSYEDIKKVLEQNINSFTKDKADDIELNDGKWLIFDGVKGIDRYRFYQFTVEKRMVDPKDIKPFLEAKDESYDEYRNWWGSNIQTAVPKEAQKIIADRYSEDEMIDLLKDYESAGLDRVAFRDSMGNGKLRNEWLIINDIYMMGLTDEDKYPRLHKVAKEIYDKNNTEKAKAEELNGGGKIENAVKLASDDYRIHFDNRTPFDMFYAPEEDEYLEDYDYVKYYNKILNNLGYANILINRSPMVTYVSDGKQEMDFGSGYVIDLRAWDTFEDVVNNTKDILAILEGEGSLNESVEDLEKKPLSVNKLFKIWCDLMMDIEDFADKWNGCKGTPDEVRRQRIQLVNPAVVEFVSENYDSIKAQWDSFYDIMEDNNFHTPLIAIEMEMNKYK